MLFSGEMGSLAQTFISGKEEHVFTYFGIMEEQAQSSIGISEFVPGTLVMHPEIAQCKRSRMDGEARMQGSHRTAVGIEV